MTDVVGSTMLTQQDPVAYGQALATHNELAETTFLKCGGKLLKSRGQGDGLLGEFESAADAVRAALAFQTALKSIPDEKIKCRYSVHYGVCYGDGEDYFGHTLNLCARLRDIGHPDQILVSATVAGLATQLSSEGIQFYDLGWHGLKDIANATRIFQVDQAGKHQPFLKLKTDTRFRLPSFGTPFVGRRDELERVSTILSTNQAVLLLGPGGIGKTRLSVRAAEVVASQKNCPCVFANLIEAVDEISVEQVLAETFGLRTLNDLNKAIDRDLILIVDNCEHVATAAAEAINSLLQSHPELKVIATSRTKLSLHSCMTLNVDGLGVDEHGTASTELFVQLAKTHDDTFELGPGDEDVVKSICSAAEGIPFVIELAAFYINSLSVRQIADRVFDLVRTNTGIGRHGSVDAVLAGTVNYLDDDTKRACGQLAWFAGGFTLDAAGSVVGSSADVLVRKLIETSLLRFDRAAQPNPRYRFLEVIRVFMRDTLGGTTPAESLIEWSLLRSAALSSNLGEDRNRQEMGVEIANFRVALAALASTNDKERVGLNLASYLARYWLLTGAAEGSSWLKVMLDKNPEPTEEHESQLLYANANNRLGAFRYQEQDWLGATISYSTARRFATRAGNLSVAVSTKLNEGLVYMEQGQLDLARPLLTEAEEYYRLEGQTQNWLIALLNLGRLELRDGHYAVAEHLLLQGSQANIEELKYTSALCNLNLVSCALLQGRSAKPYLDALETQESVLNIHGQAVKNYLHGLVARTEGDFELEAALNQRAEFQRQEGATIPEFELSLESKVVLK